MNTNMNTTDAVLVDAVSKFLQTERSSWCARVQSCIDLAIADGASALEPSDRAKVAAAVRIVVPAKAGTKLWTAMTKGTYSKRVKVGRFASETAPDDVVASLGDGWADVNASATVKLTWCDAFEIACATPSLDKFYEWLPKAEHLARAKSPRKSATVTEPVTVSEPESVPFTDDMASQVAREFLAGLRTRGASQVQISLVIAELDRLTTPVRSVPAAA